MPNMSFALTTDQIRNRTKTVTRRLGWARLKAGDHITACVKCQGLKLGEKVEKITQLLVTDVRDEPLNAITKEDVAKEGFPNWEPTQFIEMFCQHNKCAPTQTVRRIEFEYWSYR